MKIAPGVRLNVNKRSVGVSAGVRGARISVNSDGRSTRSVGMPGTGLYYRDQNGPRAGFLMRMLRKQTTPPGDIRGAAAQTARAYEELAVRVAQQLSGLSVVARGLDGEDVPVRVTVTPEQVLEIAARARELVAANPASVMNQWLAGTKYQSWSEVKLLERQTQEEMAQESRLRKEMIISRVGSAPDLIDAVGEAEARRVANELGELAMRVW